MKISIVATLLFLLSSTVSAAALKKCDIPEGENFCKPMKFIKSTPTTKPIKGLQNCPANFIPDGKGNCKSKLVMKKIKTWAMLRFFLLWGEGIDILINSEI